MVDRAPGLRWRGGVAGFALIVVAVTAATTGGAKAEAAPSDGGLSSLPHRWIMLGTEVEDVPPYGIGHSAANDINQSGYVVGDITERIPTWPPSTWLEKEERFSFDVQTGEFSASGIGSPIDYDGAGLEAVSETLVVGWAGAFIAGEPFSTPTARSFDGVSRYDFSPLYMAHDLSGGVAHGVNDTGTVVGAVSYEAWAPDVMAFSASSPDGSDAALIAPEAAPSIAWDVSNEETIVGGATFGDATHAFLLRDGETDLVDLGTLPGDTSSVAFAINDAGTLIVGNSFSPGSPATAFVYDVDLATMTGLGPSTTAADVNDLGLVVGSSSGHAFIYDVASETLTDVHDPSAGSWSHLNAIDDSGRLAVGSGQFGTLDGRAALLTTWSFVDVPGWHRFHDDIEWLADNNIAEGFEGDLFKPGDNVTRQSMAAFLYRLAGASEFAPPATPTFEDVPVTHPFFKEIEWLAAEEITNGFGDGTYRPAATITRQSMAALLYRLAGEPEFAPPATPTFDDVPVSHPFFTEIEWSASEAIAEGFGDGTYRPVNRVTRQAMAAFLHRFDVGQA